VAIAAGSDHSLALKADGTVVAWGYDGYGQTDVPSGLTKVVAIAAGADHSLALKANGSVVGWGYNTDGELNPPADLTNAVALAGGGYHSLALRSTGLLAAWGAGTNSSASNPNHGQSVIPAGLGDVTAIGAGTYHSAAMIGSGPPVLAPAVQAPAAIVGGTLSLRATASGAPPLSYQWTLAGTNLPGATQSVLVLTNLQMSQAGAYVLVVSNQFGAVASSAMDLGILPLLITSPPQSQSTFVGATASLSAGVLGQGPFTYQWQFNGANLAGATTNPLVLTSLQLSQAGNYGVAVSNAFGGARSPDAVLSVGLVAAWGDDSYGETNLPPGLTNTVAVGAGAYFSLALRPDGTVVAWGDNTDGKATVPAGLTNVVALAGGENHTVALKADGTVAVWGDNSYGQTNAPALTNAAAIAPGLLHTLALKTDGTVVGWGYDGDGEIDIPLGLANVVAIAAGAYHSLALKADGTVAAWGYNGYGQTSVPAGLSNVVAIAAGYEHSLALKADGTLVAWGENTSGQTSIPPSATNVTAIACGWDHNVALRGDGSLVVFGDGSYGQTNLLTGLTNVVAIAASGYHTLALVGGGPPFLTTPPVNETVAYGTAADLRVTVSGARPLSYQWTFNGTNLAGATGAVLALTNFQFSQAGTYAVVLSNASGVVTSSTAVVSAAPLVLTSQPLSQSTFKGATISFGASVTTALPTAYQWRFNGLDLAGANTNPVVLTNVQLSQAGSYALVASNAVGVVTSAPATLAVGLVAAWGDDSDGQTNVPPALTNAVAIAAGGYHSLVLNADGTVAAWGYNGDGETNVPPGLSNVVAISAGFYHSLALKADGTVAAWGYNAGNVGSVPDGLANVAAIAAGGYHNLALKTDGTVTAWGDNDDGETVVPAGLGNVVAIAAGEYHSLALKADGTVTAWGAGTTATGTGPNFGQSKVPTGLSGVIAIACGAYHSLALKTNGTVVAWGWNTSGQTNVPISLTNAAAITGGYIHSLALRTNGALLAWGGSTYHQFGWPSTLTNPVAIADGYYHSLALLGNGGPPVLSGALVDQLVQPGATAIFHLTALGNGPLGYQWTFNGTNLSGATAATLTISNVQPTNFGGYALVVTNPAGGVTSTVALLDLPLVITNPPLSQVVPAGGTASFVVGASGNAPFTYQWQLDGANLPGATSTALTITNAQVSDAGAYTVRITDPLGLAALSPTAALTVANLGAGTGLNGDYYSSQSKTFAGLPTLSRVDPTINFDWGTGSPDPLISADHFTVRWAGQVQPLYSQAYTFYTRTDDGVRLWVNGQLVIDKWIDQSSTEWSGTIALQANQKYDLVMEFYENQVNAVAMLSWSSAGQAKQIIPQSQLYPAAAAPRPALLAAPRGNGANLLLNWVGSYHLQTATNVAGPYLDLAGASSPYTNALGANPRQFFRLKSE